MVIRNAGIEDLELLVRLRLDYLSESRALDETETAHLSEKLRGYFARQLTCGGFAAILALEGDTALSTAFFIGCGKAAPHRRRHMSRGNGVQCIYKSGVSAQGACNPGYACAD